MEFQAIVLAGGRGTRMNELTSKKAKCLLPIGNKPMIWYPVRMLENAGFSEINIITLNSIKKDLENELKSNGIKAILNVFGIDDSKENDQEDYGTANCLYLLKDKIVKDCMIVSCDLISNVNIQLMANYFRVKNAAFVMLLSDSFDQTPDLPLPGSKGKYSPESDLIGLDLETNRLLYFNAEADVEEIELKRSLTEKYSKITWSTKLEDAHFYIMKKGLLEYLFSNSTKFCSIKSEFVPYLCKKQFSSKKKCLNDLSTLNAYSSPKKTSNIKEKKNIFEYIIKNELSFLSNKVSSINKQNQDLLSCYAFIQADGFCFRNNNLAIFAESNRQCMSKILPYFHVERSESLSKYDKSQVGSDSVVGENLKIGEKSLIKRSVIGRNCHIGEKVKITNSIVMDNVQLTSQSP